jgi:N-acetylglucosaminyldiphosphoundecaprenol N-acetyl-beta-D-mannosaminyltransferase
MTCDFCLRGDAERLVLDGAGQHSLRGKIVPPPMYFEGVPIHALTMNETLSCVRAAMRDQQTLQHVALNVAKFVKLRQDSELRADVLNADLVGVDGMGILVGARLLGIRVPERVAGVDLMEKVLGLCAAESFRPFFLGATPQVLESALSNVRRRYPTLEIAGSHHGYYDNDEERKVVQDIRQARPDCLFVGMPTPRKERFMAEHLKALEVSFVMGVGGGIDILAGHVRRAPVAWQNSGLEWLYRTLQEPRRMWRRYLVTNTAYAWILARALSRYAGQALIAPGVAKAASDGSRRRL